jgi:hypothetical protein
MSKIVPASSPPNKNSKKEGKQPKVVTPVKTPSQPPLSPKERLIMLTYGQNGNYQKWNELMANYLGNEYGQLACVMTTGKLYTIPMPTPSVPDEAKSLDSSDQQTIANIVFTENLKIWTRKTSEIADEYVTMYSEVWNYISQESQLQIKDIHNWADIERERNFLSLRDRIVITHRTGEVRIKPIALNYAKAKLNSCRQGQHESLAEYKKRFDDTYSTYKASGGRDVPEDELAVDFFMSLDSHRYATCRVEMENDINSAKRTMPATLAEMYRYAATYKVVSTSGQVVSATVFVTTNKGQSSQQQSKKSAALANSATPNSESADSSPPRNRYPCKYCGGDHWNRKCPTKNTQAANGNQEAAPAPVANAPNVKGTVRLTFSRVNVDVRGVVLKTNMISENEVPDLSQTTSTSTYVVCIECLNIQ